MKKIISLFKRDYQNQGKITPEISEGAEWVIKGEGIATEKFDGTACMIRDGILYKRYDCKNGKQPPSGFEPCQEPDEITGHWPGWVPVTDEAQDRWFRSVDISGLDDGTYELIGEKINGNPYRMIGHKLEKHGDRPYVGVPRDFEGLKEFLAVMPQEGIIWHHPDGRMVKIKRRDFGLTWPLPLLKAPFDEE